MARKISKKPNKKSRRVRGTGSIFEDKRRGGWRGKAIVGRNPKTKKLIYKWVHAPTQAELVGLMKGAAPAVASSTVGDWCDRWLRTAAVKPQSKDAYEQCVRLRIKPQLGHLTLAAITSLDIEEAAIEWGRAVGPATIRQTITALSAALQAAQRGDLVSRNTARPARKPTAPKSKIDPFTPAELLSIIRAGIEHEQWRTFAACAATGMRIGEALSLGPSAYNVGTGRVAISRTKTRRHGYGTPKSARGARTVTVPAVAREVFVLGVPVSNHNTAAKRWARLLKHLGLRRRNIHQIRHSVATHAIAAGTPIANVARDLGDTAEVIVRTYLHPLDDGRDVCSALDKLFA